MLTSPNKIPEAFNTEEAMTLPIVEGILSSLFDKPDLLKNLPRETKNKIISIIRDTYDLSKNPKSKSSEESSSDMKGLSLDEEKEKILDLLLLHISNLGEASRMKNSNSSEEVSTEEETVLIEMLDRIKKILQTY